MDRLLIKTTFANGKRTAVETVQLRTVSSVRK